MKSFTTNLTKNFLICEICGCFLGTQRVAQFVEAEAVVTLSYNAGSAISIARFGEAGLAVMFDYDVSGLHQYFFFEDDPHQIAIWLPAIGRVQKYNIRLETLAGKRAQGRKYVLSENPIAGPHVADIEVLSDQSLSCYRAFDEHHFARTAAERLDANCARSAENIDHDSAWDLRANDIEQSFLEAIPGGTDFCSTGSFQSPTSILSRNDSHLLQITNDELRMTNVKPYPIRHS
jgi:hypothetical protein